MSVTEHNPFGNGLLPLTLDATAPAAGDAVAVIGPHVSKATTAAQPASADERRGPRGGFGSARGTWLPAI